MAWTFNGNEINVELGIPNETRDTLRPLLGSVAHSYPEGYHAQAARPPRPSHLAPFGEPGDDQPWHRTSPEFPGHHDETPSEASTAANTPMAEAPEAWPKKWRRSDRRLRRLNTELLEAIEGHNVEEVEKLLNAGANPNATCRLALVSACHMAALSGGDSLALLLKFGAEKQRLDKLGRTPLHLAAWAGNARQVAILLDFPEDMHDRVDSDMSPEAEEDVKKLCPKTRDLANFRCDLGEVRTLLPKNWKDNIDHNCRDITGSIPAIQPGWTPLHVAASIARRHCTRLLLAAGADPNICDVAGRTPLDVAGSAFYYDTSIDNDNFTEVIKMLLQAGGRHNSMKAKGLNNVDTPLHTAVELENMDAINELLKAGASIACKNIAGQTPLHVCVKKELEEPLQVLANYGTNEADPLTAMVDVKDGEGHTVLQAAVEAAWVPGVCIALEAGADVTMKANDGETPIHSAAAMGNIDILNEILSICKQRDFVDCQNDNGETPLFKAIIHGHLECLRALISEGACLKIVLPGEVNVLHVACDHGHTDILKELLSYDEQLTKTMINSVTAPDKRGFGPIHFAISNNHTECVELLLSKNADVRLRTTDSPHKASTPLHISAVKNHVDIAKVILNFDKTTIHEVNSMGWFPIHAAAHHGSRQVIQLLLSEGADLSGYTDGPKKYRRTAIDMIINNLSKPTDFMEEVFDSYIQSNSQNLQDPNCVITIDYRILMPTVCEIEQMKVIQALIKTGNRYGQKRLLVHPLVESFLYLKWKALLPFFYTIIFMYALFVASLTTFVVSVFFFKDTKESKPEWLHEDIWAYVVYSTILLLLMQEILYMNLKSSRYFLQMETWVKFGSIGMATILPPAVMITSWWDSESEWPRHVATVALLLSWVELMFLLSRFPNWGYYVLMFGKVASNVVKILLTFAFLVVGFSLSFMIQFKSQMPFEGPWAALVKTVVMMTSEFEYEGLFNEEHNKELKASMVIIRIIFFVFLILASIVLMNLMVGVAVNDINDLEILGNIRRLEKQVEFLGTLDTLVYNRVFTILLPKKFNNRIKNKRKVVEVLTLCPGKPRWKHFKMLSSRLKDAIFDKAVCQKKQTDNEEGLQKFMKQIEEMHNSIVKHDELKKIKVAEAELDRPAKHRMRHDEIMKHLTEIDDGVMEMKEQMTSYVQDSNSPLEELNVKIDQMALEMENIKLCLGRLESKLEYTARKYIHNGQLFQVKWYASDIILTACRSHSHTNLPEFNFDDVQSAKKIQFYGMRLPVLPELTETTEVYMAGSSSKGKWICPKLSHIHIQEPNLTLTSPGWLENCHLLHDLKLDDFTASDVRTVVDATKELLKLELTNVMDIFGESNERLFPTEKGRDQSINDLILQFDGRLKSSIQNSQNLSAALAWQLSQLRNLQSLTVRNFRAFDFCALGNFSELKFPSLQRLELSETNITRLCFSKLRVAIKMKELIIRSALIKEIEFNELLSTNAPVLLVRFEEVKTKELIFTYADYFALTNGSKKGKVTLSGVNLSVDCDCANSLWLTRAMYEGLLVAPGVTCSDHTSPADHICELMECQRVTCASLLCLCCDDGQSKIAADCRNTELTSWPPELVSQSNLTQLLIRNNFLTSLPKHLPDSLKLLDLTNNDVLRKWNQGGLDALFASKERILRLEGNPIVCSCDNRPLLLVLKQHQDQVEDYDNLTCVDDRKKINEVDFSILCAARDRDAAIMHAIILALVVTAVGLMLGVVFYYRRPIQIYLFARGWCLYFIREEDLDSDRRYDVFLSFCHEDYELVINKMLPILDDTYSVCVHTRDFIPGEMIPTQITNCIAQSKRTVVVLSRSFLKSLWGLLEFRTAHTSALLEGRVRVVMIVADDVLEDEVLEGEVRSYIRLNTYVKWGDPWFWEKLKYALPHQPMKFVPTIVTKNNSINWNSTSEEQISSSF